MEAPSGGFGRQNILEVINSVPAADVAPVRRGRWIQGNGYVNVPSVTHKVPRIGNAAPYARPGWIWSWDIQDDGTFGTAHRPFYTKET